VPGDRANQAPLTHAADRPYPVVTAAGARIARIPA
jgi:hypothetical protein